MMPEFDRQSKLRGLNDNDLKRLQEYLLLEPTAGKVINGLRKIRFAFDEQGKSGSVRRKEQHQKND